MKGVELAKNMSFADDFAKIFPDKVLTIKNQLYLMVNEFEDERI